ncbi:MAG TPA: protein kinase [Pyrinomonadaceae bacterium]|nr:protein kinase [Pyrinomonadaceae bacterium]
MRIEAGEIYGHYTIVSAIGAGGMGEVFLAEDTKLDRRVAIKFLHRELGKDADKLSRFIREAKAASALNHPNILTVYEIGASKDTNYIVTEFIDGDTLRKHLSAGEPLRLSAILKIGVQVAEALSAAHHAGIIHRDIKPENIMLRSDGYAKVLDFGLAKLLDPATTMTGSEDATRAQINTMPGVIMGTASYMSPEQARGKPTDGRTDTWSLGVVLYEMLSGRLPFAGETVNHTIVSILEKEPLRLENVPDELQRIVRKSLTKDADMRYQSAHDILIDLKNLRRDLDIQGELERSVIPSRDTAATSPEAARTYASDPAQSTSGGQVTRTSSSSLEYAVTQARSHKLAASIAGLFLLAIVSAVGYFVYFSKGRGAQINSIAVLPFENRSGNPDSEYLSDGLAESLIYRLSQLPNLKVCPASSVMRYKGKEFDAQKIARELGVEAVMFGRISQRGDNLSISIELIDAADDKAIWGEQYERKMSDLLATQREIAGAIVEKLQLKLSGDDDKGLTRKYTSSNEAYQLYLKGRFQWNKRTLDGLKAAEAYFKQAIEKDPSFALAYASLAETYVLFPSYSVASPRDSMPQLKAAALKAIELDETLAEGHTALHGYHSSYSWNFEIAERELRRAIELNPNYATSYHWLGNFLPLLGRCEEAIAAAKRAEELDPLSAIIAADTAYDLIMCRRYDDALAQTARAFQLDPNFYYTHYTAGWAYLQKGMHNEAITAFKKSLELNADPLAKALYGQALARSGRRAEAIKILDELIAESQRRFIGGYVLAMVHAALGEKDAAFAQLEKDLAGRSTYLPGMRIDPAMDDLRDDPRFTALLKKIESSVLE